MKRITIKIATLFLFLLQGFTPAEGQDLFRYVNQNSVKLTQRQSDYLTIIKNRPWSLEVLFVKINNSASLLSRQTLSLNLPTELHEASIKYFDNPKESVFTWAGSIGDGAGSVQITVTGIDVRGMIHIGDAVYAVEPLGQGLHVLVQLDQSKFPPDESPEAYAAMSSDSPSLDMETQATASAASETTWIDILFVYTEAAKNFAGGTEEGINSLINTSIGSINDINDNSSLSSVQVRDVHSEWIDYVAVGNLLIEDRNRLTGTNDGYMDNVHSLREQYDADIVVLLVGSGGCGVAYIGATAETAFAVVHADCAFNQYSLAHEIGHLMGAYHDNDTSFESMESESHGYQLDGIARRTIMATLTQDPRIKYWSSDDSVTIDGQSYVLGNDVFFNVVQAWVSMSGPVSNFRQPDPSTFLAVPQNLTITTVLWGSPPNSKRPKLTWTANTEWDIAGYKIDRKADSEPTWLEVGNVSMGPGGSPSFIDYGVIIFLNGNNDRAYYRVRAYSTSNLFSSFSSVKSIPMAFMAKRALASAVSGTPKEYELTDNHPNPFNPETRIGFALPEDGFTKLVIYDLRGAEVVKLVNEEYSAGYHSVIWNASSVASGIYYYRLTSGDFVQTKKMLLLK